jgi:YgiT-type zinc finger domain-containing protein
MKPQQNTYDYGECEICDSPLQERRIKQDFWIRGELVVVDQVVAGVCPQCGAKVVRADIGRQLAALLGNTERIASAPRMSVPVVAFDE